jgi:SAM-dependent methyltransferase
MEDRKGVVGALHEHLVFNRRTQILARELSGAIPETAHSVLDVGCGDGTIDRLIEQRRPDLTLSGVDVLIRPKTHIPVQKFDGHHLPFPDQSFDAVMFVDVLHHTEDPTVLLREAKRVARLALVLKDHIQDAPLSRPTLRFMDWVGNAHHGVALPYNYWSSSKWRDAFSAIGLRREVWKDRLGLYPFPASLIFDRSLHFVARLSF